MTLRIALSLALTVSASLGFAGDGKHHGRKLGDGVYQLTGTHVRPGYKARAGEEVPDPAPPFVTDSGQIEIYGSAQFFLRYPNWDAFLNAGEYETIPLDLRGPDGQRYTGDYTHPWDLRKYRLVMESGNAAASAPKIVQEIIVGGAMSAMPPHASPRWPEDNPGRRIYIFRKQPNGSWLRDRQPIYGDIANGWFGHSYGGNFFSADSEDTSTLHLGENSKIHFFFEQVDHSLHSLPYRTQIYSMRVDLQPKVELFPQQLVDEFTLGLYRIAELAKQVTHFVPVFQEPTLALSVYKQDSDIPYPSTVRTTGGLLIEGPRPVKVTIENRTYFLLGFSGGDFCTDSYTVNFAWSTQAEGPYQALLNKDGTDFENLASNFRVPFNLSWMGRPVLYRIPNGDYEMMFHAVDKQILPDNDYAHWPVEYDLSDFYRMLYRVRVKLSLNADLSPRLELDGRPLQVPFM